MPRCIFLSKFGDSSLNGWWVMVRTSSKWGKIWLSSCIWPWSSRLIIPKNVRGLNRGVLCLWSKFGDPSLNEWWVIVRTSSWLIHTHGHTEPQTKAMTIPEGQNWPQVKKITKTRNNWNKAFGAWQHPSAHRSDSENEQHATRPTGWKL